MNNIYLFIITDNNSFIFHNNNNKSYILFNYELINIDKYIDINKYKIQNINITDIIQVCKCIHVLSNKGFEI